MDKMKWFVIILIPTINLSWGAVRMKDQDFLCCVYIELAKFMLILF